MPSSIDQTDTAPLLSVARSAAESDAGLLRRYAQSHDEAAFADVVHRHVDLVHSAALRQMAGDR